MNGKFDAIVVTMDGWAEHFDKDKSDYDPDVCLAIPTADGDGCLEYYVPKKIGQLFKGAVNYATDNGADDVEARTKQLEDWLRKVMTNDTLLKAIGYDDPEDYPEVYLERLGRFEAANGHYDMDFDSDDEEEAHKAAVRKRFPEGYFSFYIRAYEDSDKVTGEWCDPFWNI